MSAVRTTPAGQLLIWRTGESELRDSFERFDRENPQVYELLVELADGWRERRPERRCGIGMLFEVCRWKIELRTMGEPLKLNNNYRAFYARKLMAEHARFAEMFETRRQRFEEDEDSDD